MRQRHDHDCAVCCLSMLTGRSYWHVNALALTVPKYGSPPHYPEGGLHLLSIARVAVGLGWLVERVPAQDPLDVDLHSRPRLLAVGKPFLYGHCVAWTGSSVYDPHPNSETGLSVKDYQLEWRGELRRLERRSCTSGATTR